MLLLILSLSSSSRRSHLFRIRIGVQKFSTDSLINRKSSKLIPSVESTTINDISELSNEFNDRFDAYRSIWSFCFFLGTPAVSITLNILSSKSISSLIESLVVPGLFETTDLSWSKKELNNVDLPEFGFPIIEMAFLLWKLPSISLPVNLIKLSNNSSVPILWYPEINISSPYIYLNILLSRS